MNVELMSVMKQFAFGLIDLVWSSPVKFDEGERDYNLIGVGIWIRFSSKLTVNYIPCG